MPITLRSGPGLGALAVLALASTCGRSAEMTWQVGLGRRVITPQTPVWLAGYGTQRVPDGRIHDLWVKVLALQDPQGKRVVLATTDHMGMSKTIYERLFAKVQARFGLGRAEFMLTFSHNHCGPILEDDLVDYYPLDEEQTRLVHEYSLWMEDEIVAAVAEALDGLRPARLYQGEGLCTFAVNRRENTEDEVPVLRAEGKPLKGAVDHYVPVLAVRGDDEQLLAVLFGYACHPTTLSFNTWCGDYPGFAQVDLEAAHPGTSALFFNACGADQNPIPRRKLELAEQYGTMLAESVEAVLAGPMQPVSSGLRTAFEFVDLDYDELVTRETLLPVAQGPSELHARWANRLLKLLDEGAVFPTSYPYPVQAWQIGDELLFIGLGGEAVVDYSLRLKREFGPGTWVCGYANDMAAYIPSRRVWEEGGYEGGPHLDEYGRPAWRWAGDVEDRIASTVHRVVGEVSPTPKWVQVTDHAAWAPRDSCGEVTLDGRMWLLGGWFDSHSIGPRDVWSSANGRDWTRATDTAGWRHADLPTTVVHDGRMWFMGGWYAGRLPEASASSEVWVSADGAGWECVTESAGWSPRLGAAGVEFQGKLWVLGGIERYFDGNASHLRNDVWCSADGRDWRQATPAAPWAPRAYHAAAVFNERLWVFGGGNYLPEYVGYNDVWSSPDGVHWEQAAEHAPWAPRIWFSTAVYRNRLWVLGGWSNDPSRNWNDVWHTADGVHWQQLVTPTIWSERHEHSAYLHDDRLWVVGGNAWPLVNDVWSLHLPKDWAP